jgi:hypothetical protein
MALKEFLSTNQKTADIVGYDSTSGFLQEIAGDAPRVRPPRRAGSSISNEVVSSIALEAAKNPTGAQYRRMRPANKFTP